MPAVFSPAVWKEAPWDSVSMAVDGTLSQQEQLGKTLEVIGV